MVFYFFAVIWEWDRNNFPMGITIEYSTTGIAGGYTGIHAPAGATIMRKLLCACCLPECRHLRSASGRKQARLHKSLSK